MYAKLLMPAAVVALLAIAGCGKKEEPAAPAATAPVTAPAETAPAAAAPAAAAPAAPSAMTAAPSAMTATPTTPEEAMKAIQEQAAKLTPEQKQEAVAAARKAAEDAAKAQGLSEDQIKQAADMAESTTKQMMGL